MAVLIADSTLRPDELEPGDEIYLWDVGWDMRGHMPNVWNNCRGDERKRARKEAAIVAKVIPTEHNAYVQFENFPDWVIPNDITVRVRTHDKEQAS